MIISIDTLKQGNEYAPLLDKALLSSPAACLVTVHNRLKRLGHSKDFAVNLAEIHELDLPAH